MSEIDQSHLNQHELSLEEQRIYINTVKNAAGLFLQNGQNEWVGRVVNPSLNLNGKHMDYYGFLRGWVGENGHTTYFAYEKSPLADSPDERMMGSLEGRTDNSLLFILALNGEKNEINTYGETQRDTYSIISGLLNEDGKVRRSDASSEGPYISGSSSSEDVSRELRQYEQRVQQLTIQSQE